MLNAEQISQLSELGVTVSKTLEPDVNAIFSDQFFIESSIEQLPALDYLQVATSGLDNIPLSHPKLANAVVSGSRGVFNQPIAAYVLAHVLSVYQHHRFFTQTQKDQQWRPSKHNEELNGKRVAVIGLGQIGQEIARTLSFFNSQVDAFNRTAKDSIYVKNTYPLDDLASKIGDYDVVVVSLALNQDTKGLINAELLARLKPTSIFVNIGRSELIDEQALVNVLQQKKIRHAIVDTFHKEPLPKEHPLWSLDNVTVTPHTSFTSILNLNRMFQALYTNLQLYLQKEALINQFK